jgi:hypothetical protein
MRFEPWRSKDIAAGKAGLTIKSLKFFTSIQNIKKKKEKFVFPFDGLLSLFNH